MYLLRTKCLLVVLFVLCGVTVFAQTNSVSNPTNGRENNPYSKYGIGELWDGNNTVVKGMADMTSAYENPYQVNSDNPASYVFLQQTTFEAGLIASSRSVVGSGLSYKTGTATLGYLNLGIPISKHAGMCFGFRPVSRVYYSTADTISSTTNPTSPIGQVVNHYSGDGGLDYAYLGGAVKFGGFSIGVNVGYLFGTIQNVTATEPIDTNAINRAYTGEFANYTRIGGIYWKAGAMYERKIDSDYTINIGGTFALTQNIQERLNAFQISSFNFGDTLVNDTTSNPGQQNGKLKMPMSYSIGAIFSKTDKWSVGINYAATKWSDFNSMPNDAMNLGVGSASYKLSIGGTLIPDATNIRNYWARVTYRFGLYYGTDYLNIFNTALPVYGVTVGGTLPFRRTFSALHMSLDIGRLGTTANSLIQETYVRFSLGVSFNNKWFIPKKYD